MTTEVTLEVRLNDAVIATAVLDGEGRLLSKVFGVDAVPLMLRGIADKWEAENGKS